jgi:hypothetical protein
MKKVNLIAIKGLKLGLFAFNAVSKVKLVRPMAQNRRLQYLVQIL